MIASYVVWLPFMHLRFPRPSITISAQHCTCVRIALQPKSMLTINAYSIQWCSPIDLQYRSTHWKSQCVLVGWAPYYLKLPNGSDIPLSIATTGMLGHSILLVLYWPCLTFIFPGSSGFLLASLVPEPFFFCTAPQGYLLTLLLHLVINPLMSLPACLHRPSHRMLQFLCTQCMVPVLHNAILHLIHRLSYW